MIANYTIHNTLEIYNCPHSCYAVILYDALYNLLWALFNNVSQKVTHFTFVITYLDVVQFCQFFTET